jgi:hypothetical protein
LVARKDDVRDRQIASVVRVGGANYVGTAQTMLSYYDNYAQEYDTNPATSATWPASDVMNAEFGVQGIS